MSEPITPERLAKIRNVLDSFGSVPTGVVRALLAEVDRLQRGKDLADQLLDGWVRRAEKAEAERDQAVKARNNGRAERDRLRAELTDAHMEAARRVAPVEMGALRRQRDEARAELDQWRATFGESALRDGLARLARTEAERDRLAEQISRARDYAGHIAGSANTAYAKAGREVLAIVGPVTAVPALDAPVPGETTPPTGGEQETQR